VPAPEEAGALAETLGVAELVAFICEGAEDFAEPFLAESWDAMDALVGETFAVGVDDMFFAGEADFPASFVGIAAITAVPVFLSEVFPADVPIFFGTSLEGFAAIERTGAPLCLAGVGDPFDTTFPEAALGVGLAGGFCAGFFGLAGAAVGVVFLEGTEGRAVKFSFLRDRLTQSDGAGFTPLGASSGGGVCRECLFLSVLRTCSRGPLGEVR
jgi:hypothetical protein